MLLGSRFRAGRLVPLITALGLVAWLVLVQTDPASAHANQVRSDPSGESVVDVSPSRVTVWFSESIGPKLSEIRVFNVSGDRVDNDDSAVPAGESSVLFVTLPELPNGTYTVSWGVLSLSDGHSVVGSFRFAVGEPLSEGFVVADQPLLQSPFDPWVRWVFLASALLFSGTLLIDAIVIRPTWGDSRPATPRGKLLALHIPRAYKITWFALALMLLSLVAMGVLQASNSNQISLISAIGSPLLDVIFDTGWGQMWMWRLLLVVVAGILIEINKVKPARRATTQGQQNLPITSSIIGQLALLSGMGILFLTSLNSHGAALPSDVRTLGIANDFLHLNAAAAWVGGLLFLAINLPSLAKAADHKAFGAGVHQLVPRFSFVALGSAVVLVLTGIVAGWLQVTIPEATATPFGWALVAKVGLLVPLGLVATLNAFWVSRRILNDDRSLRRMLKLVVIEASVALLIVLAAGWMTGMEPARQFAGRNEIGVVEAREFSTMVNGASIGLIIAPGDIGENIARVELRDFRDRPLSGVTNATFEIRFLEDDIASPAAELNQTAPGLWETDPFTIDISGIYEAEVSLTRSDAFDTDAAFRFETNPVLKPGELITPSPAVTWTLFGAELVLIGAVVVGLYFTGFATYRPSRKLVPLAGVGTAVIGAVFLLNVAFVGAGLPQEKTNPIPTTDSSVTAGEAVYQGSCAACHGDTGLGDGPEAGFILADPTNLILDAPIHTDGELFTIARDGITGTVMRSNAGLLEDEQLWNLVNYLRVLSEQESVEREAG